MHSVCLTQVIPVFFTGELIDVLNLLIDGCFVDGFLLDLVHLNQASLHHKIALLIFVD